jgi:hypothetical protein
MIKLPNGLQADGTIHIVLMIETSQWDKSTNRNVGVQNSH